MSVEKLIEALKSEGAERERKRIEEANAEAEAILAEARSTIERIGSAREEARRRDEALRRKVAEVAALMAERENEQRLQQAATELLRTEAAKRWRAFMESDDYRDYVERRWEEGVKAIPESVQDLRCREVVVGLSGSEVETETLLEERFGSIRIAELRLLDSLGHQQIGGEVTPCDDRDREADDDKPSESGAQLPASQLHGESIFTPVDAREDQAAHEDEDEARCRKVSGETDEGMNQKRDDPADEEKEIEVKIKKAVEGRSGGPAQGKNPEGPDESELVMHRTGG